MFRAAAFSSAFFFLFASASARATLFASCGFPWAKVATAALASSGFASLSAAATALASSVFAFN